jgi:hypothetical protein
MGRNGNGTHYESVNRAEVPQGRKGKHRKAVADILADLSKLKAQQAVKIPLSSLNGEKMQNLRSALSRVTREKHPRANVERRRIPVRLARRPAPQYGSERVGSQSPTQNC